MQSTVLSPVDGAISSNPQEPHHRPYGGDYAFDIHTSRTKRPVFARFRNTNGSLSLTVAQVASACGSGKFSDGGNKLVLNVLINGARVGTVTYSHLTAIRFGSGSVPVGAHIGDTATEADGLVANDRCWTGPHVHVEPRNDVRYGCFFSRPLSSGADGSTPLGLIGGERATGVNQLCPAGAETPSAPAAWSASFIDQSAFTNAGLTAPWDLGSTYPGQEGYLRFRLKNTGTSTWSNGGASPVRLGTAEPRNRSSGLVVAGSWLSAGRPTSVSPASVPPGGTGTFVFKVRVPAGSGTLREHFQLVAESAAWFGPVMWRDFGRPAWSASFVDQSAFSDVALTKSWDLSTASRGQEGYLRFRLRNTGSRTWTSGGANAVNLGTTQPNDRASALVVVGSWLAVNRPTTVSPSSVPPGAVGTFTFKVRVPPGSGTLREHFRLVAEGAAWFGPVMWRDIAQNAPPNRRPLGEIVLSGVDGRKFSMFGYAIDPDTSGPIDVDVSISGVGTFRVPASRRWDGVSERVPGYGDDHAFLFERGDLPSGTRSACVTAIDSAGGPGTSLGCRELVVK